MFMGTSGMQCEKKFLDKACSTYKTAGSYQQQAMKDLILRTFLPYMTNNTKSVCLSLGYAEGYEAKILSECVKELDVIEGSQQFYEQGLEDNIANVTLHYSLFEDFIPENNKKYDYICANYVLEHVENVTIVLSSLKEMLKDDGLIFSVVPNARAFSRQLALHMGLIDDLKGLTENDINHGHRRVYDRVAFNRDLEGAGLSIIAQGGIMLKPLADFQMDKLIDTGILQTEHLNGLYRLGMEYPDFCSALYAICKK